MRIKRAPSSQPPTSSSSLSSRAGGELGDEGEEPPPARMPSPQALSGNPGKRPQGSMVTHAGHYKGVLPPGFPPDHRPEDRPAHLKAADAMKSVNRL